MLDVLFVSPFLCMDRYYIPIFRSNFVYYSELQNEFRFREVHEIGQAYL
jgi:hypothetical protein